jgi:hypothetical protein
MLLRDLVAVSPLAYKAQEWQGAHTRKSDSLGWRQVDFRVPFTL